MSYSRIAIALLAALSLAGCRTEPAANVSQPLAARTAPSGLDLVPLSIVSGGRTHRFTVEVARTSDEQAQGLMFRERLGRDEGMLFPFPSPRPASFWMRNTLIPLDMIFIRNDGTIARIAANAVPRSEEPVSSGEPVIAVLEIKGGRSAELSLREGDRVSWPR
ncbi:MAG TPA: DUF192 domain-containing protein [Allosphingosinicella sp.]|nr:DUF192 domain-containing protein [Allosphingosinicella sp.]